MFKLFARDVIVADEPVAVVEPVVLAPVVEAFPDKPLPGAAVSAMSEVAIAEYAAVAESIGVNTSALLIERFKLFLIKNDMPVYDLKTVVAYMDALAKRDNSTGLGWEWKPLRASDTTNSLSFGTPSSYGDQFAGLMLGGFGGTPRGVRAASDYFATTHVSNWGSWTTTPYDKPVPLHALKRAALIEKEFAGRVVFAVSHYSTEPHVRPDPFLIAMIPNPRIAEGIGRFVIDVWDEPGFGIEMMLK